jgi:CrcB protein
MASPLWAAIAVSVGAIPGALSRYYLTVFWAQRLGTRFPYGTFLINLTGAFLIGALVTWLSQFPIAPFPYLRELVVIGFLGSYTTFSTYALDTANLIRPQQYALALLYWAGSLILGLVAVQVGAWVVGG